MHAVMVKEGHAVQSTYKLMPASTLRLEKMSTYEPGLDMTNATRTPFNGYQSDVPLEQELKSLSIFVEPLLNYPDQYIIICTASRSLLLFSETVRSVLCPKLHSKGDLWQALGTLGSDADILTTHILDMLTQPNASPPATPISVFNRLYTVETRFITGLNTERNLILSLLPDTQPAAPFSRQQPTSSDSASTMMSNAFVNQYTPENALKYTMKLNDYVNNCRNDDIYYHANKRADEGVNLEWSQARRGSQMGEFIPTMCQPELMLFMDMAKEQTRDVVSLKVSMDSYYYDPVDPDTIPPSFTVNNTSNTGDTGTQIARKSNAGGAANNVNGDKRCYACGTEKSPEWRRGPEGPKTLCNACGLRYAKQLRAGTA